MNRVTKRVLRIVVLAALLMAVMTNMYMCHSIKREMAEFNRYIEIEEPEKEFTDSVPRKGPARRV